MDTGRGADRPGCREVEVDVEGRSGVDLFHLSRLGVEPGCGLGREPLDGGEGGGVHDVGQVRIHERSGLGGEGAGDLGDPTDAPHLHLACFEAGPDLGEPVLGLDRVGDQGPAGVGGAPQRRGELDDRELRHLGCTGPGELEHRVGTGHPEPGDPRVLSLNVGVLISQPVGAVEVGEQPAGGVAVGPGGDGDEELAVGVVGGLLLRDGQAEEVTGRHRRRVLRSGVVVPECHDQSLLEQVFEWNGREGCEVNLWRTKQPQPKRAPRRAARHASGAQPGTEIEAHRKHGFDRCRTCCSANVQAPTHGHPAVEPDRRACRERGSRQTLQSPRGEVACRRTGSRGFVAGAPRASTSGGFDQWSGQPVVEASARSKAARTSARWLKAWGKLPAIRPSPGSYSSASRPTSLTSPTSRSKRAWASSRRPAAA
jgi:hypothetical protein